ncbi:MAG: hypothetical protein LF888_06675 (plasmid) [Candidatus Megaira endosymbiont of Mesostigma viride]|nr:MAG: hypothetical protein LF888_06675 [Candidatus Megaira endosymbiont of Mesostigma viride]HJK89065.1 hypothetical protein [Candidatus Megaira endosymbiont of Mesostigma viride]
MNITEKCGLHNNIYVSRPRIIRRDSLFIPHWCYKKVLLPSGRPDLVGIHILAELLSLSQRMGDSNSDFELRDCVTYFWSKFCIRKSTLQRASFRLQNLGLVARLFYSTVAIPESQFSKELILKLNTANINALSDDEGGAL